MSSVLPSGSITLWIKSMHITEMIWLSQMSNLEINMVVHFSRYLSCLGEPSHTQEGNMTTTSMVHNHGASVLIGHLRKDSHAIFSLRVPLLCAYHQLELKMMLAMSCSWGSMTSPAPFQLPSAVDQFTTMGQPQKRHPGSLFYVSHCYVFITSLPSK